MKFFDKLKERFDIEIIQTAFYSLIQKMYQLMRRLMEYLREPKLKAIESASSIDDCSNLSKEGNDPDSTDTEEQLETQNVDA